MPAPGDQHTGIANPFTEPQQRISEFTAQEIATLQSRLEKQLGPEYISARTGPSGQKVHYIAAEKCIALANEVFGFNGWSSSIQNIQVDFVDENANTLKISLGLSVIVRVTLRDGTYHEDIGYGHIENCKGKAAAFEKAKKEGTTDGLKRALRNFGNVLGNCIYDKAYLAKVTKMKAEPHKFEERNLHRHADFIKKEPKETKSLDLAVHGVGNGGDTVVEESYDDILAEFDEADFGADDDDDGHPDEVVLPNSVHPGADDKGKSSGSSTSSTTMNPPNRPLGRSVSAGGNVPHQPQTPNQHLQRNGMGGPNSAAASRPQGPQQANQQARAARPAPNQPQNAHAQHTPNQGAGAHQAQGSVTPGGEGAGFFSARAVSALPEDLLSKGQVAPQAGQVFNPRAESPSIRKTPGIDHTTSKPLGRTGQHVEPIKSSEGDSPTIAGRPGGAGANSNGAPAAGFASAGAPAAGGGGASNGNGITRPGPPMVRGGASNNSSSTGNPLLDQPRRIGAPGAMNSPNSNRGAFRQPMPMKRTAPQEAAIGARPALADVSTNNGVGTNAGAATAAAAAGPDAKRQKTT